MIRIAWVGGKGFRALRTEFKVNLMERGVVAVLGENLDTDAADSNGAGKTTVFSALSWALYGCDADGKTTDVQHRTEPGAKAPPCEVRVGFWVGEYCYEVTRTRKGRSGDLLLQRVDEDEKGPFIAENLTRGTIRDTQEAIVDLLGLSWDAFRNTVVFGQGDHARFASPGVSDTARKEVLGEVLGLDVFDKARDKARKKVAQLKLVVEDAHEAFSDAAGDLAEQRTRLEGLDEQLQKAEASARDTERLREEHEESVRRLRGEEGKITLAMGALDDSLDAITARLDSEERAIDLASDRVDVTSTRMRVALRERHAAEAKLRSARQQGPCGECGQERVVDRDLVKRLEQEHRAATNAYTDALDADSLAKSELKAAKGRRGELLEEKRDVEEERYALRKDLRSVQKDLGRAEGALEAVNSFGAGEEMDLKGLRIRIANAEDAIEGLEIELSEREQLWLEAKQEQDIYQWWASKGFGGKGVQAFALEQALPELNVLTNKHLHELSDGDLQVRWTATTAKSSGKGSKEEMNLEVKVEGVWGARPSGGQRRKIDLASEMALATMGARGGAGVNLLLLDEALDGLDAEGAGRVVEWLSTLDKESVFFVSHHGSVNDEHADRMVIRKQDGESRIVEGAA